MKRHEVSSGEDAPNPAARSAKNDFQIEEVTARSLNLRSFKFTRPFPRLEVAVNKKVSFHLNPFQVRQVFA
jgi:hypothetical protein